MKGIIEQIVSSVRHSFPPALSSTLVMYDDEIFRKHIWYRDGEPHWAYDTPYLIKTTQRDWIYWTPNVISSQVKIQGQDGRAHIFLLSFTPNFKTFQQTGRIVSSYSLNAYNLSI